MLEMVFGVGVGVWCQFRCLVLVLVFGVSIFVWCFEFGVGVCYWYFSSSSVGVCCLVVGATNAG